jgi:hypothetical protein
MKVVCAAVTAVTFERDTRHPLDLTIQILATKPKGVAELSGTVLTSSQSGSPQGIQACHRLQPGKPLKEKAYPCIGGECN